MALVAPLFSCLISFFVARRKFGSLNLLAKSHLSRGGSLSCIVGFIGGSAPKPRVVVVPSTVCNSPSPLNPVDSVSKVSPVVSSYSSATSSTNRLVSQGASCGLCCGNGFSGASVASSFLLVPRYGKKATALRSFSLGKHADSSSHAIIIDIRIILKKKHSNAVRRNCLRRRLKEAIRLVFPEPLSTSKLPLPVVTDQNALEAVSYGCVFATLPPIGVIIFTDKPSYLLGYGDLVDFARSIKKRIVRRFTDYNTKGVALQPSK